MENHVKVPFVCMCLKLFKICCFKSHLLEPFENWCEVFQVSPGRATLIYILDIQLSEEDSFSLGRDFKRAEKYAKLDMGCGFKTDIYAGLLH